MYTPKDAELVNRLLVAAREGKTEWLPTAFENIFTASLSGKYSLQIKQNPFGDPPYELTISDQEGAVIHRLSYDDYTSLQELYEFARRQALKIDDKIDDILTELQ